MNASAAAAPATGALGYPVKWDVEYKRKHSRLLLFFRWILIIPHVVVIIPLIISQILTLVAAIVVIITRHYPKAIFHFNVGVARWLYRVEAYLYLLTDRYPPFSMLEDDDYPITYKVEYPGSVARWRPLLAWLFALPVFIVAQVLGYLVAVVTLFAFVAILITGRYPEGLFRLSVGVLRLGIRANAYAGFQVTQYPPFEIT